MDVMDANSIRVKKYIMLETYRKSGMGVGTPVWFLVRDDIVYVVTRSKTGKVKRIKNNHNVKIAVCDIRGKVTGEWTKGTATILKDVESIKEVISQRNKKYGFMAKIAGVFSKTKGDFVVFSIRLL